MSLRRVYALFVVCAVFQTRGLCAQDDYPSVVLADEPVAYYRFEEAAGDDFVEDVTGEGHDSLSLENALLGADGIVGQAVEFFGDGSIELDLQIDPADSEGDGLGVGLDDFSIEVFLKPSELTPADVFVSQMDGIGTGRSVLLITSGTAELGSFIGGGNSRSTVVAQVDTWYHFVMTYDGEALGGETLRFYVDGEPAGTGTLLPESADGNWVVGSHKSRGSQFFAGLIDELSFYDYRLDDPDGDDDTEDSRVMAHFEAAVGEVEPCAALEVACTVTDTLTPELEVQVSGSPELCECPAVSLRIDGAGAGEMDLPGDGVIQLPLPEDCPEGSEHSLEVACSEGVTASCTFECPRPAEDGPVRDEYVELVIEDGAIAYYRFDEEEGDVFEDSSGNGHHSLSSTNASRVRAGFVESAVQFDGDGSVELDLQVDPADSEGDGVGVGLDDFSIELFLRPGEINPANVFLSQMNGTGTGRSVLLITAGTAELGSFLGGGNSRSTVVAESGVWYHFVMTYDGESFGDTLRFYVDGEPAGTGTLLPESANGNWVIGSHKSRTAQFYSGLIDELSFYDYRLDDPDGDDDTEDSRVALHFETSMKESTETRFVRGDADADGGINVTDGIAILNFLFGGGETPPCIDAADIDDDGNVAITDGVAVLSFLFAGGDDPRPPSPDCGTDPTEDTLGCIAFGPCAR